MQTQTTEHWEIIATDAGQLHESLTEAEAALRLAALNRRAAGILITRHELRRYTLALDDSVPFGETREQSFV